MGISFRHSAGFGKRMEYNLVGKMLMEGLDVYLPLVDDHGVDCVIKKEDGTFIEVQIKARSSENAGKRSIWFNGNKKDKETGIKKEYCKKRFEKYIATDFSRFH